MHCVMDMTLDLYVLCKVCVWRLLLWCKRQGMTLAQRHEEAPLAICLALPFVAEPESCFARLRQSPEPDVKKLK